MPAPPAPKKRKAKDTTLLRERPGSTLLDKLKGITDYMAEPAGDPRARKRDRLDRGKGSRLTY